MSGFTVDEITVHHDTSPIAEACIIFHFRLLCRAILCGEVNEIYRESEFGRKASCFYLALW